MAAGSLSVRGETWCRCWVDSEFSLSRLKAWLVRYDSEERGGDFCKLPLSLSCLENSWNRWRTDEFYFYWSLRSHLCCSNTFFLANLFCETISLFLIRRLDNDVVTVMSIVQHFKSRTEKWRLCARRLFCMSLGIIELGSLNLLFTFTFKFHRGFHRGSFCCLLSMCSFVRLRYNRNILYLDT